MNRIILFGLAPALLLFIISSCQKENISKTTPSSKVSKDLNSVKSEYNTRIWYDNGGTDYGCSLAGGDCLDDVIVTPWFGNLVTNFASSSNQADYATAKYAGLSLEIDESLLDGVIAGDLSVSMRGSITSTRIGYLIFNFTSGGGIKVVKPFKL